jgi:CubicO group peptidase (beta-lactamase class C family)
VTDEDLDARAASIMEGSHTPGMAAAVARGGQVRQVSLLGFRDREEQLPVSLDTVFGIGSVTKSFTAMAICQLAHAGRLSVDDRVRKYLPEFRTSNPAWADATTLHHLMTHTSGLPPLDTEALAAADSLPKDEREPLQADLERYGAPATCQDLMRFIAECGEAPLAPPGAYFSYSNDAYGLLGLVIERVSGLPYADYIQRVVLDPAGMRRTTFRPADLKAWSDVITLYVPSRAADAKGTFPSHDWLYSEAHLAAGCCFNSSVHDLLRYLEIFRTRGTVDGERVVDGSVVERMQTPYIRCGRGLMYGYGLEIHRDFAGHTLIEHSGGSRGVSSQVAYVPDAGLTAVALANTASDVPSRVVMGALRVALGALADDAEAPPAADPAQAVADPAAFVGTYAVRHGSLTIEARDGGLALREEGGEATPLRPVATDVFAAGASRAGELEFVRSVDGQVLAVRRGGRMFARR